MKNLHVETEDIIIPIECTLEEFFKGTIKSVEYTKRLLTEDISKTKTEQLKREIEVKAGYSDQTELWFPKEGNQAFIAHQGDLVIKFT